MGEFLRCLEVNNDARGWESQDAEQSMYNLGIHMYIIEQSKVVAASLFYLTVGEISLFVMLGTQ